jgi:hypothetical protein
VTKTLYLEKLQKLIYNQSNIEGYNWKKFNYTKGSKRKGILIKTMKMKIERKIFFYWNVKLKIKINLTKKKSKEQESNWKKKITNCDSRMKLKINNNFIKKQE